MFRRTAAVMVLRRRHGVVECYVAKRSPNLAVQPGYETWLGERVDVSDTPPVAGPACADGATARATAHAAMRALWLHAGMLPLRPPHRAHPARLAACRERLLTRDVSFDAAVAELGLPAAAVREPTRLGDFRTPPYVARPVDVTLFGLWLGEHEPPAALSPQYCQGRFATPQALLSAWAAGHCPLAPLEAECLRLWTSVVGNAFADDDACLAAFASAFAHAHPEGDLTAAARHRPSVQVPHIEANPVRSPTLAPATHTNCYVLGRATCAVVDPGTPYADEQPHLMQWLDARAASGATIAQIWLTHHHADHIGAAMAVRQRFGAPIVAHRATAEALAGKVTVDVCVEDNERLVLGDVAFDALFTPGHASGHLCFYDVDQHHLLSGDNVLGIGTSVVVPAPDGDMQHYMAGLRRLLKLPINLLFPGHGPPAARSVERILDTLRQREMRERRLLEIVGAAAGPVALPAALAALYRGIAPAQKQLAALSLRAHIEKLVGEQALQWQRGQDGHAAIGLGVRTKRPI